MKPITLADDDAALIKKVVDREMAIQRFVALISEQGEQRLAQAQTEARKTWAQIAQKYGIDIENVVWQPSPDCKRLIPMQQRFKNA
jgi:hypothetical protein